MKNKKCYNYKFYNFIIYTSQGTFASHPKWLINLKCVCYYYLIHIQIFIWIFWILCCIISLLQTSLGLCTWFYSVVWMFMCMCLCASLWHFWLRHSSNLKFYLEHWNSMYLLSVLNQIQGHWCAALHSLLLVTEHYLHIANVELKMEKHLWKLILKK